MSDIELSDGSVDATDAFFGEQTPLRRASEFGGRAYEPRTQQREMALAVARHLDTGRHLCVEAPTGVGKTFAYLVPAIHLARQRNQPVVVSTHTISLQEQIIDKDLPMLGRLMDIEFRTALAKGRGNYLCLRRLNAVANLDQNLLPGPAFITELDRLYRWSQKTDEGSRSTLDFEPSGNLWDSINCEVGNCLGPKCEHYKQCFFMRARRQLLKADVIVANHALFFADMALRAGPGRESAGLLPPYAAVILDEGHTIEDAASNHLGLRLTAFTLRRALGRLYQPERTRGLLVACEATEAQEAVGNAAGHVERFFERLQQWLEEQQINPLRYQTPGHIPDLLSEPLERAESEVLKVAKDDEDEERQVELTALAECLREYRIGLHDFVEMSLPEHVYWFERYGPDRRQLSLHAVPIEIAPLLRANLFNGTFTVIVTSATLAVRERMEYFQHRIGADAADALVLGSPFDFERQVTLHIPRNMPNPKDREHFVPAACEHIRTFLRKTEGKAFVLFTSYQMMHEAAEMLAEFFDESGLQLYVQGDGLPRSRMLSAFREDVNSVIFGTASFWTGVDVPGESLSNVIIVRLPFAVPDHPIEAARQELIEQRGGRAFAEYSLPEAVLRFRQGFGRLIRSRDDTGIVVVLDNRILHTSYGRAFLDSIPTCRREVF